MPDNWIELMAMDAVATATELGYRPCAECGTWMLPRQMIEGSPDPETGETRYYCAICVANVNHLLEAHHEAAL